MGYCPECRSEYRADFQTCAECGAQLVESLPEEQPLVEVFRAIGRAAAQRVRDVVLHELEVIIRSRGMGAFPTPSVSRGLEFLAVEAGVAERAREILRQARQDGIIDAADGDILG